jgi:predicted ATPase
MISSFVLCDFKGHRHTELELGRFTMLVGDNASGKTSVLDALALQANVALRTRQVLQDASLNELVRRTSRGVIAFRTAGTHASEGQWIANLELRVGPGTAQHAYVEREFELRSTNLSRSAYQMKDGDTQVDDWEPFIATLGTAALYRLRAETISSAAYSDQRDVHIETDGTNTAVALATMKLAEDDAFQRVEDGLRKLVPAVERVRIRRAKVKHPSAEADVVGSKLYFNFRGAADIPADGASHGTLIVLALLTILHRANRPNLILLDDFDHALHPRAQQELVRMIKSLLALDEFKDVQIVATTHSPYVLDELETSDVYAFALRDDGTVASKRLSDHPDAERTKGALKAGQLWSLDPERDWVLRG